jgi:DNA-binding response OmpR family regulator
VAAGHSPQLRLLARDCRTWTGISLSREGNPLRLERIPMDLLILLVQQSPRLVQRSEIIERLWGKDVYLDTDNNIKWDRLRSPAAFRKLLMQVGLI